MLSKNNKILIGCLALLLVMSVGYALFSDTITINGSATAKGEFKLTTTCSIAPEEDIIGSEGAWGDKLSNLGTSKNEISCNNNIVDISTGLDYPGAYAWYKIVVTNEGTIPATLKSIDINYNNQNRVINEESFGSDLYFSNDKLYVRPYSSEEGDEVNEFYYEPLHKPAGELYTTAFTDKLPPGKSFVYYIKAFWHESDETQRPEGLTLDYTLDFNYEQATE